VKKVVSVLAMVGLLVFAASASANFKLSFGYAKRGLAHETAQICAQTEGCKSWSVRPCARRSLHRIDCRSNFFFAGGGYCTFVGTATLRHHLGRYEVFTHHKRITCKQ
jgi:hypothetical protein